jgi:hypothetical protein
MAKAPVDKLKRIFDYSILSVLLSIVTMVEGAAIIVLARPIEILDGQGTELSQSTVMLVGLQLLILGTIVLTASILNGDLLRENPTVKKVRSTIFRDRGKLVSMMRWLPGAIGVVMIIEAFMVAYFASPMVVQDIGGMRGMWLAGFAAQLFFVGMGLVVLTFRRGHVDMQTTIRGSMFLLIASAGLFVYGIADTTLITGNGEISESTVELIGIQLFALAFVALVLICINGRFFLGKMVKGRQIGKLGIISLSVVLCLEGMVIIGLASNLTIGSVGSVPESSMILAGLCIAIASLVALAPYYLMEHKDRAVRSLARSVSLFLFFLLPFSLLM